MMYKATRRFEFDAAHRLLDYDGPCSRVHGHHYVAEVTVCGPELDALGMLVDFRVLKSSIGRWIDETWDHRFLCHGRDALSELGEADVIGEFNPTAEHMASLLFFAAGVVLPLEVKAKGVKISRVRLYETPDCWVDYHG